MSSPEQRPVEPLCPPLTSPREEGRAAWEVWLERTREACGAFEWVTFTYLAWLCLLIACRHERIPHAGLDLVLHLAIALALAGLVRQAARSRSPVVRFVRHWYPLPLYIFFFEELGGLVQTIFPVWLDRWFIAFDYNIAGVHPSVWMAHLASPALNDYMQFAYMTYFVYLVLLPAILYLRGERVAFWQVMVSTAIAHYSVYVLSVLLPVESPYYSLAALNSQPLAGGYPTALIDWIEHFARVRGAAFPSAHVAGSLVALIACWRYRRWLFWTCLPFFVSMSIATVYGRYHYVADVLGGLAVGAVGSAAGDWLVRRGNALPKISGQGGSVFISRVRDAEYATRRLPRMRAPSRASALLPIACRRDADQSASRRK
jgi:membrane-associated phospholipid phosphatase